MTAATEGGSLWALVRAGVPPDPASVRRVAADQEAVLGAGGASRRATEIAGAVLGAGPLERLLALPGVTDVLVNGDGSVWIDRGGGLERTEVVVGGADDARALAVRLAGLAGRRLDDAAPYVDGTLPSGVRLHALLPPIAHGAAHLSLRIPRREPLTIARLQELGAVDDLLARTLVALVERRLAYLVTGGTGTGKTTVLGALLSAVAPDERLVVVEDVRELAVAHPHVVSLQGRARNVEGRGEVTLTDLVRQALRMRPDRLVVGEVRGAEVRELLTALNTGHEGGCGTVHANSAGDVLARLEALGALAGMSREAVWSQVCSGLDVIVHCQRSPRGRHVAEVAVIEPADGPPRVVTALRARPGDAGLQVEHGAGWDVLAARLDGVGAS